MMEDITSLEPTCQTLKFKCTSCGVDVSRTKGELKRIKNVFCSRSCAAKYNNKRFPKRTITTKCSHENCDNLVRKQRSSVCEQHWKESKSNPILLTKTLNDYRNIHNSSERYRSNIYVAIRKMGHSMLKHLTKESCFNCGYSKHRELCHIKAISSFPDTASINEVNSEYNVIPLCPNCHWEFDHGLMERDIVPDWHAYINNQKNGAQ